MATSDKAALLDSYPWAAHPGEKLNCAAGLEPLADLDKIWIVQQKEWKEELKAWEPRNRYYILNEEKQKIFFVDVSPVIIQIHSLLLVIEFATISNPTDCELEKCKNQQPRRS